MSARAPSLAGMVLLALAPAAAGSEILQRGNEAFRAGKFEEAAAIYETSETTPDALLRRFNAGVSWSRAGKLDKAMERFEEVSARTEGQLRRDALYNAAHASFLKGKGLLDAALKREADEEKLAGLAEAARAYRTSVELFRKVEPPDEDSSHNLAVARTALRACLDQALRIEEEKKRKAEEKALEEPAELLRTIAAKERLHRALARGLAEEPGSRRRLGSRRLRKSEAENRGLAEKLHHYLTVPPPDPNPAQAPPGAPQPPQGGGLSEEEKAARARAAEALSRAIEAQKDSEIAYSKIDLAAAPPAHTKAIEELRAAREAFPIELPAVIGEAIATQEKVNEVLEGFLGEKDAGSAESGLPGAVLEALKDNVLAPVAKFLRPKTDERLKPLADEEDEVVWSSRILSRATVSPGPAAPPGPDGSTSPPAPGQGGPPALDEQAAKALSEGLQREGQTALAASTAAREELAKGAAEPALPRGKEALEALRRAADLLPKPPETPEERLKKLIEKQRAAAPAAENLARLEPDARAPASAELAESQRGDGREAGGIATELEKRQDEPARKAAPKVREGEGEVFASAEALGKDRSEEAKLSIERGVKAFEEALALLQGKDPQSGDQEEQQQQQGGDQDQEQPKDEKGKDKKDKGKDGKEQKDRSHYAVTPRDARLLREEMDRKRREEEAKLFIAPSGIAVEKDW